MAKIQDVQSCKLPEASSVLSEATIKRVLHEAGLESSVERSSKSGDVHVEELGAARLELVRAAEGETGAVDEMVEAILERAHSLPKPTTEPEEPEEERKQRDKLGRFTNRYNQARRKAPDQAVSTGLPDFCGET